MNMIYLLDTCVVSEIIKPKPNMKVLNELSIRKDFCAISIITYQEILTGIKLMPEGKRKNNTENFFYGYLLSNFPVLEYGTLCATVYSDFQSECFHRGVPRPYSDTQIAATAKANGLILVTRNTQDFEPFVKYGNLMVENWFE